MVISNDKALVMRPSSQRDGSAPSTAQPRTPRPLPLKDARADLDAAVLAAYGFSPKKDLLAQLLSLNLAVAAREKSNDPVTPPGIPPTFPHPDSLLTPDCISP